MSTHSLIAIDLGDGTAESIYCHFDGYMDGVGKMLQEHYTDPEKVKALIALGDLSYLKPDIGERHDLNDSRAYCGAYHRDGGEDWEDFKPQVVALSDLIWYAEEERGAYHIYLFRDGQWVIRGKRKDQWKPIEQVKRDLEELERLKTEYE